MKKDLYLHKSKISGKGVFTKKPFKKGETIFILKGKIKRWFVKDKSTAQVGPNWIGLSKNIWIDPVEIYQYLNHSCNPNLGIKGSVTFVALRNIKKGEELTFDYSITEDESFWEFKCNCKSKKCRKILHSIQFLPKPVFNRYLPYIPSYFQKVYNKYNKHSNLGLKNG